MTADVSAARIAAWQASWRPALDPIALHAGLARSAALNRMARRAQYLAHLEAQGRLPDYLGELLTERGLPPEVDGIPARPAAGRDVTYRIDAPMARLVDDHDDVECPLCLEPADADASEEFIAPPGDVWRWHPPEPGDPDFGQECMDYLVADPELDLRAARATLMATRVQARERARSTARSRRLAGLPDPPPRHPDAPAVKGQSRASAESGESTEIRGSLG